MDTPSQGESEAANSELLSAEGLLLLRNFSDTSRLQGTGHKGYDPDDDPSDADQVSSALADRLKMLEQERASRIGDLIQAQWDETLYRSVTQRLKGKFTRHMGKVMNGQMTLSPEETVFLLENGFLELSKDGVPVSTEEVYATVLKNALSLEKYRVYSHISRLGYLVVAHQDGLRTTEGNHEATQEQQPPEVAKSNSDNIGLVNGVHELSEEDGPVTGHNDKINDIASETVSSENLAANDAVDESSKFSEDHEDKNDSVHRAASVSEDDEEANNSRKTNISDGAENSLLMEVDEEEVPEFDEVVEEEVMEPTMGNFKAVPIVSEDESSNITEIEEPTSEESLSMEVDDRSKDTEESSSERHLLEECVADDESSKTNDICEQDEQIVPNPQRVSVIKRADEVSTCSANAEDADSSDSETSSSEEELIYLGDMGDSMQSSEGVDNLDVGKDDDIVFVEVTKKEKKPLAVIDLLSDDDHGHTDESDSESNHKNDDDEDDDDDDIQVIAVCPKPTTSGYKRKRKKEKTLKYHDNVKRERASHCSTYQHGFDNSVKFPFPNLLRKTSICLPRPPPHLLPLNVRLNKEAYYINMSLLTNGPRVIQRPRLWNSYKDLQERRRNYHNLPRYDRAGQPFSPNFGDSSENGRQDRSPQPFSSAFHSVGNAASSPMLHPKNEECGGSSQNSNIPSPMPHNQQVVDFFRHAQRTAMQVAHNVLSQMTMNMPFPVPNLPPMFPQTGGGNFPYHLQGRHNAYQMPGQAFDQNRGISNPFIRPPLNSFPMRESYFNSSINQRKDSFINFADASNHWAQAGARDNGSNSFGWGSPVADEPYPSSIPKVGVTTKSWNEFKTALGEEADVDVDCDDDDVLEVPIDNAEILFAKSIKPLIKCGESSSEDVTKALKVFKPVNLVSDENRHRCFMTSSDLEVSFDAYLPGCAYKKSSPPVPALRVVVLRASDNLPQMSQILKLQRKFSDECTLQFAVVNHGEVAFYSFNCCNIPDFSLV